ncbi:MAG: LAGLIDADG family homing endonuclease, partial [Candidatus Diapherotrites archaeon]|nr:LAGLIDADG family homing endonuclease [Candidatus Diapherotrites archaeon]
ISTGSKELDSLIGGGIETQSITEVYGQYASGKCVSKETPLFYLNPDQPHLDSMEDVYQKYAVNERAHDGGILADLRHNVQVVGIGLDGKTRTASAVHLFKEKVGQLLEIQTRRGNIVRLTEQHPLLTLNPDGIQWKSAGLLEKGDFVGAPARINETGNDPLTADEAYFLGLFVAEGCANPLSITIFDAKTRQWIADFIRQRFGYVPRVNDTKKFVLFRKPTREWLGKLAHTKSDTKFVPESVLQASDESTRAFLRGYIDGDGYAKDVIETVTKSKQLHTQLSYLFARIGVSVTQRTKQIDHKPFYRTYITDTQSKNKIKQLLTPSHLKPNTRVSATNTGTHYGVPTKPL